MVKVLGIDPGTATTGWAILEEKDNEIKAISYGHISTSPKKSVSKRIKEVADDLEEVIKEYSPEESAIEDIFFFKNLKTAVKVSQSRGGMLLTLERHKLKIAEYTPLQVKQAVTGYGRADKQQVQSMVKSILNLKSTPKPDDTADAIAVAICHLQSRKILELGS
jgi:crossover junction endodeoxyribonuclease RuvC